MIRGIKIKRSFIGALLLCGISSPVYAGSTGRAIGNIDGKSSAPTKEDSADFFSEKRTNVTSEAAKEADRLRVKTMESIRTLLTDKKNSRQEYELLLRLGELHIERADFMRDLEINAYVAAYEAWDKSAPKTRSKTPPQANYKNSEACLYNAAQVFRRLVNKFTNHPRIDAAIYSLARTLGRLDDDNAIQYYRQLITSHPKSPLIPDAWLALGDFYFDKHMTDDATQAYQKVMDFKTHRAYPYAVYKLGWCFYNSQGIREKSKGENLRKSINAFQLVVKLADRQKSGNFNLRDEALKDLVMAFAEAEDTEGAWAYFKDINEQKRFYTMLERMGGMYADAGKNTKAVDVYNRLVNESPNRVGNPVIHQKLVTLYDDMQQFSNVVLTISIMQKLYALDSGWVKANKANAKDLADAKNLTERTMHRYGTTFHSRGQKIKNPELESWAAEIYSMYLTSFDKLEPAYDIRFYLADIQMAQKKFAPASANFLAVAKQKPKDGTHLKDAAFNAVDAIASLNAATKFPAVPPPGQAPAPLDIPKLKKIYADTMDFYVNILPGESAGLPMRYTAAQIYFDYGNYPEALKRFDAIANSYGKTKQGTSSARIIIAYFNEKSDWNNVIAYSKKFLENKDLAQDNKIMNFIDESLRAAIFNSAIASEKAKDFDKAASSFLEFAKIFPQDKNADRALYNSSLNQFKAGKVEDSIATQKKLLNIYPKSILAPDVLASMAETYEAIARFELAAETYKRFAQTYPNDKRAPISLYNTGVLYRGVKRLDLAAAAFSDLYHKYPNHPAANDAVFESARIRESTGDIKGAVSDYNSFSASLPNKGTDQALFATAKSASLRLSEDPKNERARRDFGKTIAALKVKNGPPAPAARYTVAKTLFDEQENNVRAFKNIALNSGKDIERQAAAKQSKLERLATAYQEVITIGNAEFAVASYFRLGELHEDFANALFNAPTPAGASQKQAAEFKSQLEKAGFPLKDEAYKFFEQAYQQSSNAETFTPWTQKTYQKMVQLAPEKHPVIDDQSASPGYMSLKVALNPATSVLAD